jgi:hypothetical protein
LSLGRWFEVLVAILANLLEAACPPLSCRFMIGS